MKLSALSGLGLRATSFQGYGEGGVELSALSGLKLRAASFWGEGGV